MDTVKRMDLSCMYKYFQINKTVILLSYKHQFNEKKIANAKPKVRDVYGKQLLSYMYLASHIELKEWKFNVQ